MFAMHISGKSESDGGGWWILRDFPSSDDDVNVESTFCNESYHEMEIN